MELSESKQNIKSSQVKPSQVMANSNKIFGWQIYTHDIKVLTASASNKRETNLV